MSVALVADAHTPAPITVCGGVVRWRWGSWNTRLKKVFLQIGTLEVISIYLSINS